MYTTGIVLCLRLVTFIIFARKIWIGNTLYENFKWISISVILLCKIFCQHLMHRVFLLAIGTVMYALDTQ